MGTSSISAVSGVGSGPVMDATANRDTDPEYSELGTAAMSNVQPVMQQVHVETVLNGGPPEKGDRHGNRRG